MTVYDDAALRLQAALDAPPSSRLRVDLNDVRTLLAEHFEHAQAEEVRCRTHHPDRSTRTEEPMSETPSADGRILLRQRPLPDQCDYLAKQLAPHIEPGTMPREALIAVGATIVNLGAIGTAIRALMAKQDTVEAELDRVKAELDARIAAESADAAAGSYAGRACVWPECLTEVQQLELAQNVHRSMLGEESTGPDPAPDCDCPERLRVELAGVTARAERAEAQSRTDAGMAAEYRTEREKAYVLIARMRPDERFVHDVRRLLDVDARGLREPQETVVALAALLATRNGERTALERAADEQGLPLVCDVDKLTAPEHERLSDEEWTAYAGALGIEASDEQGSTRDQIERFLTDDGRRKVVEFLAEAAGDDDIDIDAVIAQNHADAHREYFGDEQDNGEGGGAS